MAILSNLAISFALASSAAALSAHGAKPFRVEQVRNANYVRSGPLALARAYNKYNVPLPEDLANAVERIKAERAHAKRETGTVIAQDEGQDATWYAPVKVGTPPQTFNVVVDSGSADFWVYASGAPRLERGEHPVYDPSKSSTSSRLIGSTWEISYADGSSSGGIVYKDVVSVGGVTVSDQAVESAVMVSGGFTQEPGLDGILGLGFKNGNQIMPLPQDPFFESAKSELTQYVWTANLKHNAAGTYDFGFIDDSSHTGAITYTPVDSSQSYWAWTSPGYQVGSGRFNDAPISAIADTGTTILLVDDSIVRDYYAKVPSSRYDVTQGGYVFPCSTVAPSFTFGVEGSRFTIPSEYMNFASLGDGSDSCFGGLQSNQDLGFSIFGDVALKSAFVIFDGTGPRLGWAPKKLD